MRERERERERERQTDRQTDRQRQRDRQTKNGGERVCERREMNIPPQFLTDTLNSGNTIFVCSVSMKTLTATFVLA